MPLGIQRLNARHQQPNSRIIFIKPLPGPTSAYAQDFLERIAAICHPIMKSHHLSIMTLEEYEPNREFVGRNFNAGEIIQLVLRAPYTGHWLPFRSVQMVMMHELAHCVQMNHSGAFWKVRNLYAEDLRELWRKKYTGDGFWGRGKTVLSEEYDKTGSMEAEVMAERICGGTFRSGRRGKRKRRGGSAADRSSLTYAERQQKRIAKKFGVNGVALGDDEETRMKLENGKKPKGKPKVAGSARGRELRAAAALARFAGQKEEEPKKEEEEERESGSETESDYEDGGIKHEDARDLDGSRLLDGKGNSMIKVCDDEDQDDIHVKNEMHELQNLNDLPYHPSSPPPPNLEMDQPPGHIKMEQDLSSAANPSPSSSISKPPPPPPPHIKIENNLPANPIPNLQSRIQHSPPASPPPPPMALTTIPPHPSPKLPHAPPPDPNPPLPPPTQSSKLTCPVCTTSNSPGALVCRICAHVLDAEKVAWWRCQSESCAGSGYVNAADCGVCGICGGRRREMGP